MLRPTTVFAALLIGCALPAGQALAQYYPPDVYRDAPAIYPDDDPRYADPPADYRQPAMRPPGSAIERGPYDPRPYPTDRYGRSSPPPYADANPYGVPRPPPRGYPDDPPAPPAPAHPPGHDRPPHPRHPPPRSP